MAVPQVAARETAIVFGIGPGLGWALAKRLMTENLQVGRLLATKRSGAFRLSKALMEVGWHMYDNSEDGTIVRREATIHVLGKRKNACLDVPLYIYFVYFSLPSNDVAEVCLECRREEEQVLLMHRRFFVRIT